MPKILIYYEHKVREYQYCQALKYELRRRGYSVGLCHIAFRGNWWHKLFSKPKVVVAGGASLYKVKPDWSYMDDHTNFLRGRPSYYVNLQVEQICRDEDASTNTITSAQWRDSVYYICWGERRRKQILSVGIPDDHVAVTGAMHLDFLRPEFAQFYKTKQEMGEHYGIPSDKKWILIVSSFTYATMPEDHVAALYRMIKLSNQNFQYTQSQGRKDVSVYSLGVILDWIDRYLYQNDDCVVIYRPHPKELKTEDMQRMLESYPERFFSIADESIQQWISVCDVVDSWISTAIVEAFFAKKQTNVVQPVSVPRDYESALFDGCEKINTYELFEEAQTSEQQFCENTFPVNKEQMYSYYETEGPCAYIRVADFIEKVYHLPPLDMGKSRFTIRRIFSKLFLTRFYCAVYARTRIKFSKISPIFRRSLRKQEQSVDTGIVAPDLFVTAEDKKLRRKIKKYVKEIAGRDLSQTTREENSGIAGGENGSAG